jgi:hypothetical protein
VEARPQRRNGRGRTLFLDEAQHRIHDEQGERNPEIGVFAEDERKYGDQFDHPRR